jgi:hypothetical protein
VLAGQSRIIYAENASGLLKQFSEGPSDCRRAVLRISESLLSFAGDCSQPQITTNFIQRVCLRYKEISISGGEISTSDLVDFS